jgi:probable phosphoglycerate mutase
MLRARETCEILGFGEQAEIEADLKEWDYGIYEGKTTASIQLKIPNWSVWTHRIVEGEAVEQVGLRADRIISKALSSTLAGGKALLVAHAHILRILAAAGLKEMREAGESLRLQLRVSVYLGGNDKRELSSCGMNSAPCSCAEVIDCN